MVSNARYEPAPQRDSFEEPSYSQAPPSYQATAEPAPRTEGDNLPDDFKVWFSLADFNPRIAMDIDKIAVWRQRGGGNHRDSDAVRSQGLFNLVCHPNQNASQQSKPS